MITVKRAFGCLSLRTSGLILGILDVLLNAFFIILTCFLLLNYDGLINFTETYKHYYVLDYCRGLLLEYRTYFMTAAPFYLIISLMHIFLSLLLIRGIMLWRYLLIVPWLGVKGIGLVIGFILSLTLIYHTIAFIFSVSMLILASYFWICVYSLYKSMQCCRVST